MRSSRLTCLCPCSTSLSQTFQVRLPAYPIQLVRTESRRGPAMPSCTATTDLLRAGQRLLWFLMLSFTFGCSHERYRCKEGLSERILAPLTTDIHEEHATVGPVSNRPDGHEAVIGEPGQSLTVAQAIDMAFRQQPRLRVYLESVEQARRAEDIAFAPFLPMAVASYSVGGFDLKAGGEGLPLGPLPGFTFLPSLGAIPIGLNIDTGYELADLKLQWLICDFGRRLGRYRQAGLAAEIAQLQSERAYQTVANEVAVAYYQVLRTRALRKTARDAVRRAEDDLEVAKNLEKGGALEKEKRLRVEVQLAESHRLLDAAEGAEAVAVAALNLAIGLNVNAPVAVQESSGIPPFTQSLAECLQTAVGLRREFQVARQSIQVADEGQRVARAD